MRRLALVGVGRHAQRAYLPALAGLRRSGTAGLVAAVDVAGAGPQATATLRDAGFGQVPVHEVPADPADRIGLHRQLDRLRARAGIDGVIVSTEPMAHRQYLDWALTRRVPALVDKPVLLDADLFVDPAAGANLVKASEELALAYLEARSHRPDLHVVVATHRRFNPVFRRARAAIAAVYEATGCPVTSVLAEHCDGEWRTPREAIEQAYHPYTQGYGAMGHSGYHILDAAIWLASTGRGDAWAAAAEPDGYSVGVSLEEHAGQVPPAVAERMLPPPGPGASVPPARFSAAAATSGEVDAHTVLRLGPPGRTDVLVAVHMQHASWSRRTWRSRDGRDPYLGNGRVGQETFVVHQGPMQTLRLWSWQHGDDQADLHAPGAPRDYRLQIFRNPAVGIVPHVEEIRLGDLETLDEHASTAGPGKEAIVREFVASTDHPGGAHADCTSDLDGHRLSMRAFGVAYALAARDRVTRTGGASLAGSDPASGRRDRGR